MILNTKIDRRRNYYLIIDVETANSGEKVDPTQSLVYDVGAAIIDRNGNVFDSVSTVVNEVFYGMADVMQTAFYANKLPQYHDEIYDGYRAEMNFYEVRKLLHEWAELYDIRAVIAHNARFDYTALNATQRFITKSQYRYFLPFGVPIWDTMKMAEDTICKEREYIKFCEDLGYLTKNGKPRKTAEILYQYLSGNVCFKEEHKGIDDVMIEKEIFSYCMRHHRAKEMRRELWKQREPITPVFVKDLQGRKFKIGTCK